MKRPHFDNKADDMEYSMSFWEPDTYIYRLLKRGKDLGLTLKDMAEMDGKEFVEKFGDIDI